MTSARGDSCMSLFVIKVNCSSSEKVYGRVRVCARKIQQARNLLEKSFAAVPDHAQCAAHILNTYIFTSVSVSDARRRRLHQRPIRFRFTVQSLRRRQYQRRIRALPSIAGSEPQLSRTPQHTTHCKSHQSACDRANPCIRAKVCDCMRTFARSRAYASTSKNPLTHQTRRRAWACMNDIVLSTAHTHTHTYSRAHKHTHLHTNILLQPARA